MDEFAARALMFAVVPLGVWFIAHLIAKAIKPLIPDGPVKDMLYRP